MSVNKHPFILDQYFSYSTKAFCKALKEVDEILFITHACCVDGSGCEAIMKEISASGISANITYVSCVYGDKQAEAIRKAMGDKMFDMVILADMSIKDNAFALDLLSVAKYFYIFDHHPNEHLSIRFERKPILCHDGVHLALQDFGIVIQKNASGAMLMFLQARAQGLLPQDKIDEMADFINLVSDYDTHAHKIPDIRTFTSILAHECLTKKEPFEKLYRIGTVLLEGKEDRATNEPDQGYHEERLALMTQYHERRRIELLHCKRVFGCAIHMNVNNSVSGTKLKTALVVAGNYRNRSIYYEHLVGLCAKDSEYPRIIVIIDIDGAGASVRSIEGDWASKIAKAYGGGGHGNASGIPAENVEKFLTHLNAFKEPSISIKVD